ncbi:hypothetical protein PGTUg99_025574 [Puccinia graminis f. sp. tritici]|uniref:Uncharacterized protein n=1 Tax=Puccinia graminis f. sp. tritici TaxID=56615 RepID=A0A5B0PJI8_PUCGR|nr:hypothetical protein PGTUg99_025574 [Puccinia graminis f. sp. tritici]
MPSSRHKLARQPRASQRCRVKPTTGIYAPRYEAPPIFRRGGTGQANGIRSVKHPSTRARGVPNKAKSDFAAAFLDFAVWVTKEEAKMHVIFMSSDSFFGKWLKERQSKHSSSSMF